MSVQQFCLRWNNHQPNFISVFTSLLNSESLVDVTLAAEGKHLQAHKVVLSACSVYFQTLFTANPSRHPIVILKDVKHADLKILVNFMYYGEVNVSQEQLPQILETAKMLKIKGLTEMPEPAVSNIHTNAERPNLLTPGDSSWHSDIQRHSISPHNLSPSIRRKRHRKSSAGSRSTSVERISEGKSFGDSNNLIVGKTDAIMLNSLNVNQFCSNKSRIKEQQINDYNVSKDSFDENGGMDQNLTINTEEEPNDCNLMRASEHPLEESGGTGLSQQASQWTLMDHGYPRYAASCQANSMHSISSININNIHSSQETSIHSFGMPSVINPYDYQTQGQTQSQGDEMDDTSPGPSCSNVLTNVLADSQQILPPPKRRRTSNPQSEENFQRALEAVRFGGIGFCKAARMFGVNNRTLWLEYKKKGYPNNRPSIKNRIKQEHSTPPPEIREELPSVQDQQLTLLCPPHPVSMMGFIDSRHVDFASSIPNVNRPRFVEENMNIHTSPINLHGINFNSIQ